MTKPSYLELSKNGHFESYIHVKIARVANGFLEIMGLATFDPISNSWKPFKVFLCLIFYRPKIFGLALGLSHNGSCIAENLRFYHYYYKSSQDSLTVTTCVHALYVYGYPSPSLASGFVSYLQFLFLS